MMFPRAKNLKTVFMSIAMVNFVFIFEIIMLDLIQKKSSKQNFAYYSFKNIFGWG